MGKNANTAAQPHSHDTPDGWHLKDDQLCRNFTFSDFSEAFGFMARVALLAEQHQHHPNWSNVYKQVAICLSTHEAGNKITKKDTELAMAINQLFD